MFFLKKKNCKPIQLAKTNWFKQENKSLNYIQLHSDCFQSINIHVRVIFKDTSTNLAKIQQKKKKKI